MENKKHYIRPEVSCVAFEVEHGFALSQGTQRLGDYDNGQVTNSTTDDPFSVRKNGYFGSNNDDWD